VPRIIQYKIIIIILNNHCMTCTLRTTYILRNTNMIFAERMQNIKSHFVICSICKRSIDTSPWGWRSCWTKTFPNEQFCPTNSLIVAIYKLRENLLKNAYRIDMNRRAPERYLIRSALSRANGVTVIMDYFGADKFLPMYFCPPETLQFPRVLCRVIGKFRS